LDNAKKILIIDEDEDVCRMLKTRFSTFGHTVYLSGKKDDPLTLLKKKA
jgi:DNA-binding response OmpR family regulator